MPAEIQPPHFDHVYHEIHNLTEPERRVLKTGLTALLGAVKTHNDLADNGKVPQGTYNEFADSSLTGDVDCEKVVIGELQKGLDQVRIHSEEHGVVSPESEVAQYTAVLDGIDGSKWYLKNKEGYGTLLGIYEGDNPRYGDYLFSGIADLKRKRILFALKGKGAFELTSEDMVHKLEINTDERLTSDTNLRADFGFDSGLDFEQMKSRHDIESYELCTAAHYIDFALSRVQGLIESTRKGNLEIGAVYGVVRELGGVMGTFINDQFIDLENFHFKDFGQEPATHIPVIAAASQDLAEAVFNLQNPLH